MFYLPNDGTLFTLFTETVNHIFAKSSCLHCEDSCISYCLLINFTPVRISLVLTVELKMLFSCIWVCVCLVCVFVQMESMSAGKRHAAAVEAYTRQCMKSQAAAASDDGARGRAAGVDRGPTRACRSNEQLAMSELMNGRESRPNNLVCGTRKCDMEEIATYMTIFLLLATELLVKSDSQTI